MKRDPPYGCMASVTQIVLVKSDFCFKLPTHRSRRVVGWMSLFTSTVSSLGGSMKRDPPYGLYSDRESYLPDKLRFKLHRADAVDLAVDVMIAVDQADVLDLGADLNDQR